MEHIFDDPDELVGVELGNTGNIRALGLQKPHHRRIENGAKLHDGVFEE